MKNVNRIKKYAPYFLILIIVSVVFFSGIVKVSAQGEAATATPNPNVTTSTVKSPDGSISTVIIANPNQTITQNNSSSTFNENRDKEYAGGCGWNPLTWGFDDCLLKLFYYWLFGIANFILYISAQVFNVMMSLSINSMSAGLSDFVSNAWVVVRDLSNIFFLLILLYVAIQTILGLGHGTKKMIVNVIIMALLINFSLFFTKVVIDSSNILALVFYNKLNVNQTRPYTQSTQFKDKDVGGEIYQKFDGSRLLTDGEFIKKLDEQTYGGKVGSFFLKIGMLIISGFIAIYASYTFFVSGFLFLGRLIELWILMIFSPFAFMSFALPALSTVPYIGWKDWSHKLIASAFMAPIFMFFLYLIFKLMDSGLFDILIKKDGGGFLATILGALIPALLIIQLLKKAVDIAKKGSGEFGAKFSKGIEMVGGLATTAAIGAASGGAALALRAGVTAGTGKLASMAQPGGRFSNSLKDFDSFARKRTFDLRTAPEGIKSLVSKGNIFGVQKGGVEGAKERQIEKSKKRAEEVIKRDTKNEKDNLESAEIKLKETMLPVKLKLEDADHMIKDAKEALKNAKLNGDPTAVTEAKTNFKKALNKKEAIKNEEVADEDGNMVRIKDLEKKLKHDVHEAKYKLEQKAGITRMNFATELENRGNKFENRGKIYKVLHALYNFRGYSAKADKAAATKIRLGEAYKGVKEEKHKEEKHDQEEKHDDHGKEGGGGSGHPPAGGERPPEH